mmetsp:Transcript_21785/g.34958  ORF Transcript_21785/g.34958 Transcript_21785/m.34958 type:complete len:92 (+) Transcript_21785:400-675(+)
MNNANCRTFRAYLDFADIAIAMKRSMLMRRVLMAAVGSYDMYKLSSSGILWFILLSLLLAMQRSVLEFDGVCYGWIMQAMDALRYDELELD